MSIAPVMKNINPYVEKMQKKGQVLVQSITSNPGGKMGSWTYRGYGSPKETSVVEKMIFRAKDYAKPLGTIDRIV